SEGCRLVVAIREGSDAASLGLGDWVVELKLAPLGSDGRDELIRQLVAIDETGRTLARFLLSRPDLDDISDNPRLVTLLWRSHRERPLTPQSTRGEVL